MDLKISFWGPIQIEKIRISSLKGLTSYLWNYSIERKIFQHGKSLPPTHGFGFAHR